MADGYRDRVNCGQGFDKVGRQGGKDRRDRFVNCEKVYVDQPQDRISPTR